MGQLFSSHCPIFKSYPFSYFSCYSLYWFVFPLNCCWLALKRLVSSKCRTSSFTCPNFMVPCTSVRNNSSRLKTLLSVGSCDGRPQITITNTLRPHLLYFPARLNSGPKREGQSLPPAHGYAPASSQGHLLTRTLHTRQWEPRSCPYSLTSYTVTRLYVGGHSMNRNVPTNTTRFTLSHTS